MRLLRFAAFAGLAAVLPVAGQNVALRINPQQVNVTTQQPFANVEITRLDNVTTPTSFVPNYDQVLNNGQPWVVLQRTTDDASVFCSGQTICQAPGNFRIRLYPDRVPAGAAVGFIGIGGTGIQQNSIQVNVGSATGGVHTITGGPLNFTQTDLASKSVFVTNTAGGFPNYLLTLQYQAGQPSGWLTVSPQPDTGFSYSLNTITATPNTASLGAGTYNATLTLTRPGTFIADATIPVSLTISGSGRTLSASPTSLTLTTASPSAEVIIGVSPNLPVPHTITTSPTGVVNAAIARGASTSGELINGTVIQVTAINPAAVANGFTNVIITPDSRTGYNTITIPVSVNPQVTSGRFLTATPSSVSLSQFASTVNVSVVPSTGQPIPHTLTFSPNLQTLRAQGYFSVVGPSPDVPAGGGIYSFFANTSVVPAGTQGTVTFVPDSRTGYQSLTIPVYINGSGTGGGTGSLSISPSSLTFDVSGGSGSVVSQSLTINSSDLFTPQSFQASASSSNNWLSVSPTFSTTPTTLTVSVNPASLTTAGTFQGSVVLTPYTGVGAGFPIYIPVTVNVTNPFTVSANPSSVTLTAPSGGSTATAAVQLNLASGSGNPSFTTSVNTASGGNWLNVATNSSTVPATLTISANPSGLSPGFTYSGTVSVLSGTTTILSIPVSFTVNQAATLQISPSTLTFTHQTTGTSNPPAQTAQITSTGASVGWSATATSAGNWLQVSPASGNTPGALSISVIPTGLSVGTYNGQVTVSSSGASNSPQTISVSLTVVTPAVPVVLSLLNASSFAPSVAVPGLIFTIRGTDLGPATPAEATVSGGAIDTTLGGVRVLFDGTPAPLLYVSANQINGVMPFELYGRFSTRMTVEARGQRSRELELRVADSAPGIFTLNASGSGQGAILNQNGTINGPSNQAARGEIIVIYATGQGQTNPPSVTGRIATQTASPLAIPTRVSIGGVDAEVLYAGPAPGLISGAMQLNVRVPENAPTGTVPVAVQVGSATSQAGVTVSIR